MTMNDQANTSREDSDYAPSSEYASDEYDTLSEWSDSEISTHSSTRQSMLDNAMEMYRSDQNNIDEVGLKHNIDSIVMRCNTDTLDYRILHSKHVFKILCELEQSTADLTTSEVINDVVTHYVSNLQYYQKSGVFLILSSIRKKMGPTTISCYMSCVERRPVTLLDVALSVSRRNMRFKQQFEMAGFKSAREYTAKELFEDFTNNKWFAHLVNTVNFGNNLYDYTAMKDTRSRLNYYIREYKYLPKNVENWLRNNSWKNIATYFN